VKETNVNFDRFKEVFHHSTDTIDMKKARLVLLLQQWKIKVQKIYSLFDSVDLYDLKTFLLLIRFFEF